MDLTRDGLGDACLDAAVEGMLGPGPAPPDGTPWAPLKATTVCRKGHAVIGVGSGLLLNPQRWRTAQQDIEPRVAIWYYPSTGRKGDGCDGHGSFHAGHPLTGSPARPILGWTLGRRRPAAGWWPRRTSTAARDGVGVTPRLGKNCTLRANEEGWPKTSRREAFKFRRFRAILPLFKAWPKSLVFGHACSAGEAGKLVVKASSVSAARLSVQFCPFRGRTPMTYQARVMTYEEAVDAIKRGPGTGKVARRKSWNDEEVRLKTVPTSWRTPKINNDLTNG